MDTKNTISLLNDLIETCKDGEYGFRECAEHAKAPELKTLFTTRAQGCARAAQELQAQVVALGGSPDQGGSVAGAVHRGWVSVRSKLTGYDDKAMLEECERGEDVAVAKYRKALEQPLDPALRQLVQTQYEGAQRNHDEVKAARNRYRQAAA
ncbi:ferritin-like domain-containing protein [Aquabacterium sp. J223]|uniref:ferritin-like domain-containing protein n=1 Tax=Aquabacterium sp. J223 TaxID=2898431 RepID=UPI0021ADBB25|nr:PA2169 family four-helix-bundle protein [Aquabacterium sp. J223]UUX94272.1 PA2169 family four-helix-bundle protein [Aquabacterium sp. J223]